MTKCEESVQAYILTEYFCPNKLTQLYMYELNDLYNHLVLTPKSSVALKLKLKPKMNKRKWMQCKRNF